MWSSSGWCSRHGNLDHAQGTRPCTAPEPTLFDSPIPLHFLTDLFLFFTDLPLFCAAAFFSSGCSLLLLRIADHHYSPLYSLVWRDGMLLQDTCQGIKPLGGFHFFLKQGRESSQKRSRRQRVADGGAAAGQPCCLARPAASLAAGTQRAAGSCCARRRSLGVAQHGALRAVVGAVNVVELAYGPLVHGIGRHAHPQRDGHQRLGVPPARHRQAAAKQRVAGA